MSARIRLLFATTNRGKLREVQAILANLPVNRAILANFPSLPQPVENGATFADNAAIKALHYARLTKLWTIADDSGLEVDALGGEPGVLSARYAGHGGDDRENNAKLIRNLAGVPSERRTARFRCAVALAGDQRILASASGAIEGVIVDDPRGDHGFGYDPHFFVPEYGMTTAQMPLELKNRISHRGRALRELYGSLETLLRAAGADL